MKKILIISLFCYIPLCSVYADSIHNAVRDTVPKILTENNSRDSFSDLISSLTLCVNAVNNVIQNTSCIIAILTFATILAGFFGYKNLKKKLDSKAREVDEKLAEIASFKENVTEARHLIKSQDNYVHSAIGYLYHITEQIINQMEDQKLAMEIYKDLFHKYHVANLYSADKNTRFAALAYLKEKGTQDDIEHLQLLSSIDSEEKYRNMAIEIIGIIKYRENGKNINH